MKTIDVISDFITAWESFCFNYRSMQCDWGEEKIFVPEFIFKAKWPNVDTSYMLNRWKDDEERYCAQGSALVHIFFLGLDEGNKKALLRYANIIQE